MQRMGNKKRESYMEQKRKVREKLEGKQRKQKKKIILGEEWRWKNGNIRNKEKKQRTKIGACHAGFV